MPNAFYTQSRSEYQSEFDQVINAFYLCGCIVTPLFAAFLISDYSGTKSVVIPNWVFVMVILMPSLGIYGSLRYKLRPTIRTFLRLLELTLFSTLSLLFAFLLIAGLHSKTSWLYRDYLWYYGVVFVAIVLVTLFLPRLRRSFSRRIKEKCQLLDSYSQNGDITGGEVYRALFTYKNKNALQSKNGKLYIAGIGSFSAISVGLMAIGGGKFLLFYSFIGALLVTPFLLAMIVHGLIFYPRYLVNDRVAIVRESPDR